MEENAKTFQPTTEWMRKKYNEMNDRLFGGELGRCYFNVFTTGEGSQGGVLGWFKITRRGVRIRRSNRSMFLADYDGYEHTVNHENFFEMCWPTIELNGNYTGTENGFLATLVHEMCHYYTYMNGYAPRQGHGPEFRQIGAIVSSRSNGEFTIQRIASAEQMSQLELNDEMKAKREKRLANKKSKIYALLVYKTDGDIQLTMTSSQDLIREIVNGQKKRNGTKRIFLSNDETLIETAFSKGYKKNMRTWRFWHVGDKGWARAAYEDCEGDILYDTENTQPQQAEPKQQQEPQHQPSTQRPKKMFSIKTSKGQIEIPLTSFVEMKNKLRELLPNVSEESLAKLLNNPANYRDIMEEGLELRQIIEDTIKNVMADDSVEITPDMNLGLYSPLEIEQ